MLTGKEWYAYDKSARRSRVLFQTQTEHFAFVDHSDIIDIKMIDTHWGYIQLKTRHRRSFFECVLPDSQRFFFLDKSNKTHTTATPQAWCLELKARGISHSIRK